MYEEKFNRMVAQEEETFKKNQLFKAGEIKHYKGGIAKGVAYHGERGEGLTAPVTPKLETRVRGEMKEYQLAEKIRRVCVFSFFFFFFFFLISFSHHFSSSPFSPPLPQNSKKKKKNSTPPTILKQAKSTTTPPPTLTLPLPPVPSPPPSPPVFKQGQEER